MFDTMTRGAALAFFVLLAPDADAQRWEGLSLKKRLEVALANNPEILLAEAKVRQAEAEHQAMRLKVTKQVLELNASYKGQREIVKMAASQAELAKAQFDSGQVSAAEWMTFQREYLDAQNQLAQLEAQAHYLLGVPVKGEQAAAAKEKSRSRPMRPMGVPERFEAHMKIGVSVEYDDMPLADVIAAIGSVVDNEQFVTRRMKLLVDTVSFDRETGGFDNMRVTLSKGEVAIGDLLLMLADRMPVRFVFRDYGILVTTESRAMSMRAPTIPPDVPYVGRG